MSTVCTFAVINCCVEVNNFDSFSFTFFLTFHTADTTNFTSFSCFSTFVSVFTAIFGIFGGFDVEESSPLECVGRARVPIIFFHGTNDGFVPEWMCDELFAVCASKKAMVKIDGADHGLAYPKDKDGYLQALPL